MRKWLIIFIILFWPALAFSLPDIPGAQGWDVDETNGTCRGTTNNPKVFYITNLNDSGSHSLRECITASGCRLCVFEISGEIPLSSPLQVDNPFLGVRGETAPDPGIHLRRYGVVVRTHDVLFSHIRMQVGDEITGNGSLDSWRIDALSGQDKAWNWHLYHVEGIWSLDEQLDLENGARDGTIEWSLFGEALRDSVHPEGSHSMGFLWGDKEGDTPHHITFHHNAGLLNRERNPKFRPGLVASNGEFINNWIYDPFVGVGWNFNINRDSNGTATCDGLNNSCDIFVNVIKNYYQLGPDSSAADYILGKNSYGITSASRIYLLDNIHRNLGGSQGRRITDGLSQTLVTSFASGNISSTILSQGNSGTVISDADAFTARLNLIAKVGSRPMNRAATTQRIINYGVNGNGSYKDCVRTTGCAGTGAESTWPTYAVNTRSLTFNTLGSKPAHGVATTETPAGNGYLPIENDIYTDYTLAVEVGGTTPPPTPTPTPTPAATATPDPGVPPFFSGARAVTRMIR